MVQIDRGAYEYVTRYLEGYVSPEKFIENLRELSKDLVNASVDCEIEGDYGGDRAVMYVSGYRKLSPAEKAEKIAKHQQELEKADARDREAYERLKKRFGE